MPNEHKGITPLPWKHYHNKLRAQFSTVINEIQTLSGESVVAWTGFDAADHPQRKANAAYIVHACNSLPAYEELALAAEDVLATVRAASPERLHALDLLRAALKAVKPRPDSDSTTE